MSNLSEKKGEWLSIRQFAKKAGKSRAQIYLNIRLGKVKPEEFRVAEFEFDGVVIKRKQLFYKF